MVKDNSGQGIPAATLRLQPDGHTAVAGKDGRFSFSGLYPGRYYLTVTCIGFDPVTREVQVEENNVSNLVIELIPAETSLNELSINGQRENTDNVLSASEAAQVVMSISAQTIAQMGSRRLDEVLREQTGMAVVSDVGNGNRAVGLQMQGFSSEYITILLNGQPMGGRHGGNFDLSRISIHDIERIEIVKGASCSFYGSEALGGTINIITKQQVNTKQLHAAITSGSFNTHDVFVSGESPFASGNGFAYLSANYYSTDGFNVNPYLKEGKTAPPYQNLGMQGRGRWQLSKKGYLNFNARYAGRNSRMDRNYGAMPTSDRLTEHDLNGMVSFDQQIHEKHRLLSRYSLTSYSSDQYVRMLQNQAVLQQNTFTEYLHRFEQQHAFTVPSSRLKITTGAGAEFQITRDAELAGRSMANYFGYSQVNFTVREGLDLVAGARYDGNTTFGGRLNPTAGVGYKPLEWLAVNISVGTGYKTPTYRQIYQRFTNMTQGYTVLGTHKIDEAIEDLKQTGEIQQVWALAGQVKDLKAERSASFNAQVTVKPVKTMTFTVNGFYNNIRNLIISQQIGIKSNGSQLFSWFNISRMDSRGMEVSLQWQPAKGLNFSAGYQLLDMKDQTVLDSIRAASGNYAFVRADGGIRASTTRDYFGLPNRSRHSGSIQAAYYYTPWNVNISVRSQLRGKYGFLDIDNNHYIDQYDVFVKGYMMLNSSVQKKFFRNSLTATFTVDNITNYTDYLMPNQPGRMFTAGLSYTLGMKK